MQCLFRGISAGEANTLVTTIADNTTNRYVDADSSLVNGTTYFYVVRAIDRAGNHSGASNEASAAPTTSGVITAPPLDPTVATDLATASSFLYSGPNPVQTGVAPGTIEPKRAAVLRGKVLTRGDQALDGVLVTVNGHPELGQTRTRVDGMFDLAVNGGGLVTLSYVKSGFVPGQRQAEAPWQDYATVPDLVMVPLDQQVTAVAFGPSSGPAVAQGSPSTDADGTRTATLLFPAGTEAELVMPDGTRQQAGTLHVRATEFTVGPDGPKAMPGELPASSGYTYAVELGADEAIAAGATDIVFSQPVPLYVENFLNFPVGMAVPAGYYDRNQGEWIPSDDGRVVRIISETAGRADLDSDGDGVSDTGADLGVNDTELERLASLYEPGQSLWRVPVSHFTPWDCNWPYGPPLDAEPPQQPPPVPDPDQPLSDPDSCQPGSVIGCESQSIGESVPITGTPFRLHYSSGRALGRTVGRNVEIPTSGAELPRE